MTPHALSDCLNADDPRHHDFANALTSARCRRMHNFEPIQPAALAE